MHRKSDLAIENEQKMRSAIEIIDAIKNLRGLDTDSEVAHLLGLEPKTFCVAKSRGSIAYRHLINMANRENISLEWLLHGTGSPEKDFSPQKQIDEIKKCGILNTKQLSFMIAVIQRSYHAASMREDANNLLSKEVVNLGRAFLLVLKTISFMNEKKRISDFMFFFYLDWPPYGEFSKHSSIEQFIGVAEFSLSKIGRTEKVPCHVADKIASCFSVLVQHPMNFSLPENTFVAIRGLLEPWCFRSIESQISNRLLHQVLNPNK